MAYEISNITNNSEITYIRKANSLIQLNKFIGGDAGKSLSKLESKVLLYAISLIDPSATVLPKIEFLMSDFFHACGKQGKGRSLEHLSNAILNLSQRKAWIGVWDEKKQQYVAKIIGWVYDASIEKVGTRWKVNIVFDPKLAPALLQLKSNYTLYPAYIGLHLESRYAISLYELLCSYEGLHEKLLFSIAKLTELLDLSFYEKPSLIWAEIKDAVGEINKNPLSDLHINATPKKEGDTVTHVLFEIERIRGKCLSIFESTETEKSAKPDDDKCSLQEIKAVMGYEIIQSDMKEGKIPEAYEILDLIVQVMQEVQDAQKTYYTINKNRIAATKVQEKFKAITEKEVRYALDCIHNADTVIRNPKSYVRVALFNASESIAIYESSKSPTKEKENKKVPMGATGRLGQAELEAIFKIMGEEYPTQGALSNESE